MKRYLVQLPAWANAVVILGLLAWVVWFFTAGPKHQIPELYQRMVATGLMNATDLPYGWGRRAFSVHDSRDVVHRSVTYRRGGPGIYSIPVSHSIMIYRNEEESKAAFLAETTESFPAAYADRWITPPEMVIAAKADEIRIECLSGFTSGDSERGCSMIARYGNVLSHVRATVFERSYLTMPQYRRLVERVDAKMDRANKLQGVLEP